MTGVGGPLFEDFAVGARLRHAAPRTVRAADLSLYASLTGDRRPLSGSAELARALGLRREIAPELLVFHLVFGQSVADISYNAIANLGYAGVQFFGPVYPGDTVRAESEVIGRRATSSGRAGIVYVRTDGVNQRGEIVVTFRRWVLVPTREPAAAAGADQVPALPAHVEPHALVPPAGLDASRFGDHAWATGGARWWDDLAVGDAIAHPGGATVDDAEHVAATRLYQNTARVHTDAEYAAATARASGGARRSGRLVYGGHVISLAWALAQRGLENVLAMVAWNAGTHANPVYAGDTVRARTEILARAALPGRTDLGALRLRLVAVVGADPDDVAIPPLARPGQRVRYPDAIVLDLDSWCLIPRRG